VVSSISTAAACQLPPLLLLLLLLLLQAGRKGCASVYGITAGLCVPVLPVRSVQVSGKDLNPSVFHGSAGAGLLTSLRRLPVLLMRNVQVSAKPA
jgi:hypothetical protein